MVGRVRRVRCRATSTVDAFSDDRVSGRTSHEITCVELRAQRPARQRRECIRAAGDDRDSRQGRRRAGGGRAWRDGRRQESEHRHVPRDGERRRRHILRRRHRSGNVRSDRGAAGIQEARSQGHSPRDRQDDDARSATGRGRHRGGGDRVDRVAARRRDDEGSRRQHHRRRARGPSFDQPQFHRLHRTSSRNRAQHQHRVVRLGFHLGQRRGLAQQQLHAGWRQQQRRRHRPACRHAGADADRVRAGVPGHHESVRRAVRPHHGCDHQRGHQERHQRVSRRRVRVRAGRRLDGQGLFRQGAQSREAGHETNGVRRHARRAHRQGPGAFLRESRTGDDRSRRGGGHPGAARPELEPDHAGPGVEHDGEVRSADQLQSHLGRSLAARSLAAAEPGHPTAGRRREPAGGLWRQPRGR